MVKEKIIWVVPVLILLIGCAAVISLYFVARSSDEEKEELQYNIILNDYSVIISTIIDIQVESLDGLKNVFFAFDNVTLGEFTYYTSGSLDKYPGVIQALEWIPEVTLQERTSVETEASDIYNISNLTIKGVDRTGNITSEGPRPLYYPVFYINPLEGNEKALLFDLSSEPLRLSALNKAKTSGQPSMTNAITLVQADRNQAGFLIFDPVVTYELLGFSLGVYQVENLIVSGLAGSSIFPVVIIITESDTNKILLIIEPDSSDTGWVAISDTQQECPYSSCSQNIVVVDKNWTVTIYPLSQLTEETASSTIIISVGLVFTLIITLATIGLVIMRKTYNRNFLLQKQMEARSVFVSYIFHEIRVPFHTIIVGVANLMNMQLPPDAYQTLQIINQAAVHSKHVMDDILDMAKIEKGKLEAHKVFFNSEKMVQDAYNLFLPYAEEKGIILSVTIDPKLNGMDVFGDDFRLNQSLSNYISNAIKHTDSNGNVEISTVIDNIEVIGDSIYGDIRFQVVDSGCGISEENQEKLFTPYTQVEAARSSEVGTGLGLTITKFIVEKLHNGKVGLSSTEEIGSTFYFIIRAELRGRINDEEENISGDIYWQGLRLLVVDDNKSNTYVLHCFLTERGASVAVANSGKEAIDKARNNEYDVILMDRRMPRMDGIATTREIRKFDENVTIIGLTGNPEDVRGWDSVGVETVLAKPLDFKIFYQTIKNIGTFDVEITD